MLCVVISCVIISCVVFSLYSIVFVSGITEMTPKDIRVKRTNYITLLCRCTVEGMLWCWRRGIPQCLGCMVGRAFVPAEASFRLSDGTGCSCQCKVKMEERCLRDNVLLNNALVR